MYTFRYDVMLKCWQEEPHDRPSFPELREKFGTVLLAEDDAYIDLQVDDQQSYYHADEEEREQIGKSEF